MRELAATTESPEFTGRVIDALARDPALMNKSGKVLIGAELALEYGVSDTDGRQPPSHRAFFGETTLWRCRGGIVTIPQMDDARTTGAILGVSTASMAE